MQYDYILQVEVWSTKENGEKKSLVRRIRDILFKFFYSALEIPVLYFCIIPFLSTLVGKGSTDDDQIGTTFFLFFITKKFTTSLSWD